MATEGEQGEEAAPFAKECASLRAALLSDVFVPQKVVDFFDGAKTTEELNALEKVYDSVAKARHDVYDYRLNNVIDDTRLRLKREHKEEKYAAESEEMMRRLPFLGGYNDDFVYYKKPYFAKEPPRDDGSFDRRVFKFCFGELIDISLGVHKSHRHWMYPEYGHTHSIPLGERYKDGVAIIHFASAHCFMNLNQQNVVDLVSFCYEKARCIDDLFQVRVAYQLICLVAEYWFREKQIEAQRLLQRTLDVRCCPTLRPGSKTKPAKRERDDIKHDDDDDDGEPANKRAKLSDATDQASSDV